MDLLARALAGDAALPPGAKAMVSQFCEAFEKTLRGDRNIDKDSWGVLRADLESGGKMEKSMISRLIKRAQHYLANMGVMGNLPPPEKMQSALQLLGRSKSKDVKGEYSFFSQVVFCGRDFSYAVG